MKKRIAFDLTILSVPAILLATYLTSSCTEDEKTKEIVVTGVSLDKKELTLIEEGAATLVATVMPEDATNKNVNWTSESPGIAEVDETGKVTAIKAGETNVTATTEDGGKTAICKVTVTEKIPEVFLKEVSSTENSLTFTLTPKNATSVSYILLTEDQEITAEQLFDLSSSIPADATKECNYTFDNLMGYTDYTIAAAAYNEKGYSGVAKLSMQTSVPTPVLTLSLGQITSRSARITITSENVKEIAYVCIKSGETAPEAPDILSQGTKAKVNVEDKILIENLEAATGYQIFAIASDLSGQAMTEVQNLSFTTGEEETAKEPQIGDFYYSDGTWSSELDLEKTPIGLVFYKGCAAQYNDFPSNYYMKDGITKMEHIHGYAVALNDATNITGTENMVWWSFFDSKDGVTDVSVKIDDFLGYSNTKSIIKKAQENLGGLTGNNDNYPACYYATVAYEKTFPAPETSSGWFFPSAYQFKYIFDKVYFKIEGSTANNLEKSFEILGEKATPLYTDDAEFWTSTEKVDSYGTSTWAYYFSFDSRSFKPGFIADYRKNAPMRVRSMLVF